jgi:hypothetical protein
MSQNGQLCQGGSAQRKRAPRGVINQEPVNYQTPNPNNKQKYVVAQLVAIVPAGSFMENRVAACFPVVWPLYAT